MVGELVSIDKSNVSTVSSWGKLDLPTLLAPIVNCVLSEYLYIPNRQSAATNVAISLLNQSRNRKVYDTSSSSWRPITCPR